MPFVDKLPVAQLEKLALALLPGMPKPSPREYAEAALDVVSYVLGKTLPEERPQVMLFRADPGLTEEDKADVLRSFAEAQAEMEKPVEEGKEGEPVKVKAFNLPWALILKIALEALQKLGPLVG